ncbi:MAG: hypothetical protein CH6_4507 [Candidatus Kapaibacterium sp.]|nr:MAG: hypothetical protein CH6_4507 [Candidatus Kapabacteria bacterium]
MKTSNILVVLITAVVVFAIVQTCRRSSIERVEIVKYDTIEIVKPVEKIVIQKAKPRIKIVRDTIIKTKPFVAELDTIVKSDTVSAKYTFPENLFELQISRKADTFRIPQFVVARDDRKKDWLDKIGTFVVGVSLGFLIAKIK